MSDSVEVVDNMDAAGPFITPTGRWPSGCLDCPGPLLARRHEPLVVDAIDQFTLGSGWVLAMFEHESSAFVGVASLRIPAMEPHAWTTDRELGILGYSVARHRWGRGFAGEGPACATAFAFEDLGLARLRATPLSANLASRRVLERLGFSIAEFGVEETPAYGGPPRLGDVYMLERRDWLATGPGVEQRTRQS